MDAAILKGQNITFHVIQKIASPAMDAATLKGQNITFHVIQERERERERRGNMCGEIEVRKLGFDAR